MGAGLLAVALARRSARHRLALGAVAGAVLYGATLPWLVDFSPPGYVVMALLETGLLAVAAAITFRWWALPAALVLMEAAQTRFPLGGSLLKPFATADGSSSCPSTPRRTSATRCPQPSSPPRGCGAREFGRTVLQAAPTDYSAIVLLAWLRRQPQLEQRRRRAGHAPARRRN